MANQEDTNGTHAPYPPPPFYLWSQFTEENEKRLQQLRAQTGEAARPLALDLDARVPEDLALLQPPPVPQAGRWRVFGQIYDLSDRLPTLEEQGVARLGASVPPASEEKDAHTSKVFELKKLSKSLLLNFLELAGILAINPNDATEKLADLQTIFFNIHQHINEWRPHQTREALISLLQAQLERTRNETRALHEVTDNMRKTLISLGDIKGLDSAPVAGASKGTLDAAPRALHNAAEAERSRIHDTWAALDETFG